MACEREKLKFGLTQYFIYNFWSEFSNFERKHEIKLILGAESSQWGQCPAPKQGKVASHLG